MKKIYNLSTPLSTNLNLKTKTRKQLFVYTQLSDFMKRSFGVLLLTYLLFFVEELNAQPWTYDFGTGTGTHTSSTASTSFLPTPPSGGSYVRVGTNPGSIVMANAGLSALGSGTELQITSNTSSTSTTKFSINNYTSGKTGYVKFKIAIAGGTNGVYKFSLGDGANYADNNAIGTAQIFAGIEWTLGASNTITYRVLNSATYGTTGITGSTTLFTQSTSTVYLVEVYANNNTASENYFRNGTSYSLANATWDFWVDGTRVGTGLAKGGIGTNVIFDSYAFNHQNSVSAPGTIYLDDVEYANNLPKIFISDNGTQVAAANVNESTNNHILHKIKIDAVSGLSPNLTGMTCTTAGAYDAADITNLKVRYSTDATLDGADATLSTLTSPGAAGSKTFSTFTSQTITGGTPGYIFITADIAASSASGGNTISLDALTTSNLTFSTGIKTGTTTAGGTQTIISACTNPSIGTQPTTPQSSCTATNTTFTVAATGTSLTYQWQDSISGGSWANITSGTSGTFTYSGYTSTSLVASSSATATRFFRCIVYSSGSCPVPSDTARYIVNDVPAQPGTITNGGTSVCQGQTGYTYSISAVSGASGYTWSYTGTGATITPSGTSATVDFSGSATSGNLTVTADNSCGSSMARTLGLTAISCTNTITTTIASYGPFCNASGNAISVAFTSTGTYTGDFFVQLSDASGSFPANSTSNLISSGTSTSPISATIPAAQAAGTGYRVRVVNQIPATQSGNDNGSDITVTAATTPSVSIAITTGTNPTCAGSSVTFTATPTNGGGSPTYQWKLNGSNIATGATYTSTTLATSDVITCVMTTSATCTTAPTATSSGITMTVNAVVTPSVSIAITTGVNPTCTGNALVFTATPTNGGTPSFQWKLNGGNVGTNSTTYSNSSLADGSVITCVMTSTATCASPTTATSSGITITNNTPAQPTFTTSSTAVALGQTGVLYTVSNVSGVSYAWSYSGSGATITGAPSNSVTIDFSTSATSGNLSVTPSYLGCTGTARVIAITAAASNESNVVDNTPSYSSTTPEFNINPDYINFIDATSTTTGKMIPMKLKIQDGGNDLTDADKLNTILTGIKFTVRDHLAANQLAQIKTAILTTSAGTVIATASKVGTELVFTGMSGTNVTAVDVENAGSGERIIHLRVSFDETQVIDNTKLVFQVSSVTAGSNSSTFAAADGGAAQSDNSNANDRNRVEITATKLLFVQQPSTSSISSTMTPSPSVRATDTYNRTDADYATSISITSTGTMTGDPISATPSTGISTYASVVHTVAGTGLTLTATSGSLTSVTSNTFDITTYVNGDWHSITGSGLLWNNTANWMQVISGSLSAPGGGGGSGYPNAGNPNVHLYATMNTNGSRSVNNLTIYSGAQLTTTSGPCTVAGTLLVKTGGTMNMSNLLNINGTLQVDSAGTFIYAYTNSSSRSTSVWNGVENFHPKSNFVLTELQNTAGFLFIEDKDDITENTYNGFTACFGNMSFERASGSGAMGLFPSGFVKNLAHGNVVFKSGTSDVRMADAGSGFNTTIGGRLIIESTFGSNAVVFSNAAVTGVLNVKGQVIHNGTGALRFCSSTTTTNMTMNIDSSMAITNTGNFTFNATNNASYTGILRIKGDLTVATTANLTNASTGKNGIIVFNGIGDGSTADLTQVINISATNATRNQYINFNVGNGAYVQLGDTLELGTGSKVTDSADATLDFGFIGTTPQIIKIVSGASSTAFQSIQKSILKITHPQGIDSASVSTTIGNVQGIPKSNRNFSPLATFWYIGKTDQETGDAIGTSTNGRQIICDLASNTITLTPTDSFGLTNGLQVNTTIGGNLDIRRGQFTETETAYITGSTGTLYMAPGTLYKIKKGYSVSTDETGFSGGTFIPRMLGSTYAYVLNGGTIELAGDSTTGNGFQTLRGTLGGRPNYKYVKFSSNNYYHTPTKTPSNYKNLSSATTVDSAVIVTDNAIVDCIGAASSAQSFTGNGALVMSANSRIRFKNTSNTQPELDGNNLDYSLTGGTVEFYGTSSIQQQQLRGNFRTLPSSPVKINYYNIDINAAASNLQTFTSTPNSTQLGSVGNVDVNSSFLLTGALNVNAPAVLRMDQTDFIDNGTGSSQVVNINSGAGLLYANANGIKTSGTGINDGNIRTSGTRTFSTSANYGFVSSGDMASGNGLPTTVAGLYIYKTFKSNKVTLNNGGTLVNGILGLQKGTIISSDAQKVTLAVVATSDIKSPANVGGVQDMGYDSSYIEGKMGHNSTSTSSMIFPIGSTSIYGPIALTPQGTTTQTYSCEYTSNGYGTYTLDPANSPQLDHVSKVEWWNVTSTASGSNDDAKVKLFWRAHSQVSPLNTDWSNLRVAHFDATDWNTEGNSPTITGSVTTWGSVESDIYVPNFSPVTLSTITANNPLPVEITKFIGSCNGDYVQLDWTTASEKDSKLFIIERSTDGIHFENIGNVNAAGFSNTIKNYTFIDSSSSTDNYYRLVELDIDNAQQTSVIIKVSCDGVNGTNIFYTPTNGVEVEVYSTTTKELLFNVYEVSGRLLHQEIKQITQGYNKFSLELKRKLANGIYLIQQIDGSKSTATKVWVH